MTLQHLPDTSLAIIVNNLSNYYDLIHLKRTDHYFNSLIQKDAPVLRKIAQIYPLSSNIRLSMNAAILKYEEEHEPLFGHSLKKTKYNVPDEKPNLTELNYTKFCFSAQKIRLALTFNLIYNTVNITYGEKHISYSVSPLTITNYVNKVTKLYHKAKIPGNYLFLVLKADNSLDIIVTNSKLHYPTGTTIG